MEGGAELINAIMAERRRLKAESAATSVGPVVLPVRKVQSTFPSMITVGRARNNDIVVPDALVSKFHAFFRQLDDGEWGLADAGSANGTKLGEVELAPKGAARARALGRPDHLRRRVGFPVPRRRRTVGRAARARSVGRVG